MPSNRSMLSAAFAALVVAGCGGDKEEPEDHGAHTVPGESTSTAPVPSPQGSQPGPGAAPDAEADADPATGASGSAERARSPAADCLKGSYVSSSFVGKRRSDTPFGSIALSGRGRGLALDVADGRWTLRGVGSRPMHGSAMGIEGTMKVNGSAHGRVVPARRGRLRFRQLGSRGTVTLSGLGTTFELPVSVVAPSVVPDGPAKVSCVRDRLTIDSASGVLRLTRR